MHADPAHESSGLLQRNPPPVRGRSGFRGRPRGLLPVSTIQVLTPSWVDGTEVAQPSSTAAAEALKPELRRALGRFATGVAVITTLTPTGEPYGLTINSFVSVSMQPPLVCWNVIRGSHGHSVIQRARRFVVNVMAADQREIASRMSRRDADRFADVSFSCTADGLPVLDGTLATFECTIASMVLAGDHELVLGLIDDFRHRDGSPLLYANGDYALLQQAD